MANEQRKKEREITMYDISFIKYSGYTNKMQIFILFYLAVRQI